MGEGLPLPWPFPWARQSELVKRAQQPGATTASALRRNEARAAAGPLPIDAVRNAAEAALSPWGASLPPARSVELYVIQAVADISGGSGTLGVIYPPEFLYVLDAGLESRVGGFFFWHNVIQGDPAFPDTGKVALRSIDGADDSGLVFPKIPGALMLGIKDGTPEEQVREELTKAGLRNLEAFGFFWTAQCTPFKERSVCAEIERNVPFVRYAEADHVVRLIDFSPGWTATRLV